MRCETVIFENKVYKTNGFNLAFDFDGSRLSLHEFAGAIRAFKVKKERELFNLEMNIAPAASKRTVQA